MSRVRRLILACAIPCMAALGGAIPIHAQNPSGSASAPPLPNQPTSPVVTEALKEAARQDYRKALQIEGPSEEKVRLLTEATLLDPDGPNYPTALEKAKQELADAKRKAADDAKARAAGERAQQTATASRSAADTRMTEALAARRNGDRAAARAAATSAQELYRAAGDSEGVRQAGALLAQIDQTQKLITYALAGSGLLVVGAVAAFVFLRKRTHKLEMVEGPEQGRIFKLTKELTTIGAQEKETDIVISDAYRKISRKHCQIARNGRHCFLIDCSRNGTFLNGRAIAPNQPVLLHLNDEITLCDDVVLIYR